MTHPDQTQTKSQRALPVFLIALGVLVVLVILAVMVIMMVPIPPHFPPEDPEITAKRLSPENGFYALERSLQLLQVTGPSQPQYLSDMTHLGLPPDPENEEAFNNYLLARPYTTEDLDKWLLLRRSPSEGEASPSVPELREWRQQLIDELVAYFEKTVPAMAEMREGLDAEYYLQPEIGDSHMGISYLGSWRAMARTLVVQAKCFEAEGMYREAMNNYLDTIRLGMSVGSDGPIIDRLVSTAITSVGLNSLNASLHRFDDPELLRDAIYRLQGVADRQTPFSRIFEYEFRMMIDNMWSSENMLDFASDDSWNPLKGKPVAGEIGKAVSRLKGRVDVIRFWWNVGVFWDDFLQVVDKPFLEFEKLSPDIPPDPLSQKSYSGILDRSVLGFTRKDAAIRGTIVSVALRLYRIEHGVYPDALNVLVPDYLEALPADPFSGKSFVYSRKGDDFLLYGLGDDSEDDGGVPLYRQGSVSGDQIIHQPYEELLATEARRRME